MSGAVTDDGDVEGGRDEGGGGQLKLADVILCNVHLVSGAVTNDGDKVEGGGDVGDVV